MESTGSMMPVHRRSDNPVLSRRARDPTGRINRPPARARAGRPCRSRSAAAQRGSRGDAVAGDAPPGGAAIPAGHPRPARDPRTAPRRRGAADRIRRLPPPAATSGCVSSTNSTCTGAMFSPTETIMSSTRPCRNSRTTRSGPRRSSRPLEGRSHPRSGRRSLPILAARAASASQRHARQIVRIANCAPVWRLHVRRSTRCRD